GLEHENASKATLLNRLENFFIAKYRAGYHCLLMIDESQNLPFESLEELRMLSNFYQGSNALVQIFLLGQEQFRDMLYMPKFEQLRQRVVAATHLEALSARDTRDYILHRLERVGWTGENPAISKRAFAHIYALTKGIPRRINTFCDRLLLFASLEELQSIDEVAVQDVAKELMFEGTGKPGAEKESVKMEFSDSEASELLGDEEEDEQRVEQKTEPRDTKGAGNVSDAVKFKQSNEEKQVEEEKAPAPEKGVRDVPPVKSKPNLMLIDGNGAVKKTEEPIPEPQIPLQTNPVEEPPEAWVLSMVIMNEVYQSQDPVRLRELASGAVLDGMTEILEFVNAQRALPANSQLVASSESFKKAVIYYVRNVLLNNSADYYRRLALLRDAGDDQVKAHYQHLFKIFQPAPAQSGEYWDKSIVQRINQAYATLRDRSKRNAYDVFLNDLADEKGPVNHGADQPFNDSTETEDHEKTSHKLTDEKKGTRFLLVLFVLLLLVGAAVTFAYIQYPHIFAQDKGVRNGANEVEKTNRVERIESPVLDELDTGASIIPPTESSEEIKGLAQAVASPLKIEKTPVLENVQSVIDVPDKKVEIVKPAPEKVKTVKVEIQKKTEVKKPAAKIAVDEKARIKAVTPKVKNVAEQKPKVAAAQEVEKKSTPTVKVISKTELNGFMQSFALSYEEGELEKFMTLFANNAVTNDQTEKSGIRKDYEALFNATEMRVIEVTNLNWKTKDMLARGKGDFVVTILMKNNKNMRRITGQMSFGVVKENGRLLFSEMLHTYSSNP
ncbi:MAG: AAA family ATPase, partial [Gammaproteobacteria bacterium]|nr:AAA family ATPase [Gammaproteobacteria bacterium]